MNGPTNPVWNSTDERNQNSIDNFIKTDLTKAIQAIEEATRDQKDEFLTVYLDPEKLTAYIEFCCKEAVEKERDRIKKLIQDKHAVAGSETECGLYVALGLLDDEDETK